MEPSKDRVIDLLPDDDLSTCRSKFFQLLEQNQHKDKVVKYLHQTVLDLKKQLQIAYSSQIKSRPSSPSSSSPAAVSDVDKKSKQPGRPPFPNAITMNTAQSNFYEPPILRRLTEPKGRTKFRYGSSNAKPTFDKQNLVLNEVSPNSALNEGIAYSHSNITGKSNQSNKDFISAIQKNRLYPTTELLVDDESMNVFQKNRNSSDDDNSLDSKSRSVEQSISSSSSKNKSFMSRFQLPRPSSALKKARISDNEDRENISDSPILSTNAISGPSGYSSPDVQEAFVISSSQESFSQSQSTAEYPNDFYVSDNTNTCTNNTNLMELSYSRSNFDGSMSNSMTSSALSSGPKQSANHVGVPLFAAVTGRDASSEANVGNMNVTINTSSVPVTVTSASPNQILQLLSSLPPGLNSLLSKCLVNFEVSPFATVTTLVNKLKLAHSKHKKQTSDASSKRKSCSSSSSSSLLTSDLAKFSLTKQTLKLLTSAHRSLSFRIQDDKTSSLSVLACCLIEIGLLFELINLETSSSSSSSSETDTIIDDLSDKSEIRSVVEAMHRLNMDFSLSVVTDKDLMFLAGRSSTGADNNSPPYKFKIAQVIEIIESKFVKDTNVTSDSTTPTESKNPNKMTHLLLQLLKNEFIEGDSETDVVLTPAAADAVELSLNCVEVSGSNQQSESSSALALTATETLPVESITAAVIPKIDTTVSLSLKELLPNKKRVNTRNSLHSKRQVDMTGVFNLKNVAKTPQLSTNTSTNTNTTLRWPASSALTKSAAIPLTNSSSSSSSFSSSSAAALNSLTAASSRGPVKTGSLRQNSNLFTSSGVHNKQSSAASSGSSLSQSLITELQQEILKNKKTSLNTIDKYTSAATVASSSSQCDGGGGEQTNSERKQQSSLGTSLESSFLSPVKQSVVSSPVYADTPTQLPDTPIERQIRHTRTFSDEFNS